MTKIQELMQASGVAFGTSGVRGLVAQMTPQICAAYSAAFIQVLQRSFPLQRVAIGIDLRPSSPEIAAACALAVEQAGLAVDYCGAIPTPALAYYAQTQNMPAIMVTGSHIPFDRNGIKFYRPDGEISKADELAIINAEVELIVEQTLQALPVVNENALNLYAQRYLSFFPQASLAGLQIGLYEHSSVARDIFKQILQQLGAQVTSLERTSTFVPIDTEAVAPEDIQRGRAWSKEYGFDAIISTDGDGDRPLISDEQGNWLRGDIVGLLTSRYLHIDQVAVPVSCNTAIESSGAFKHVIRTRIGSPYVIAAMQECDPNLGFIAGFEANGGFLLGAKIIDAGRSLDALPTRDAVLPALAVLAASQQAGGKISQLLQDLPQRYTASDRVQEFPTEISQQLISSWSQDSAQLSQLLEPYCGKIMGKDLTDGLRIEFEQHDIVHLRASGNAPELRCYCESNTAERAVDLVKSVLKILATFR